jgi:hypothetical protein
MPKLQTDASAQRIEIFRSFLKRFEGFKDQEQSLPLVGRLLERFTISTPQDSKGRAELAKGDSTGFQCCRRFIVRCNRVVLKMVSPRIRDLVDEQITPFASSRLAALVAQGGPYAIKFVQSKWALHYSVPRPLKISESPAQTWGTATYVTPLAFPLSSALYGRIGLVAEFDPTEWKVFDATTPSGRSAYIQWARTQPTYFDLLLTVHSTQANHFLRNHFRETFNVDCVLFHPDQEADLHTDKADDVWMAVTDWTPEGNIDTRLSGRLANARFTVLLDEDFQLQDEGLPIRVGLRQIERVTESIHNRGCIPVHAARSASNLPTEIVKLFNSGGYLHVYIVP